MPSKPTTDTPQEKAQAQQTALTLLAQQFAKGVAARHKKAETGQTSSAKTLSKAGASPHKGEQEC